MTRYLCGICGIKSVQARPCLVCDKDDWTVTEEE